MQAYLLALIVIGTFVCFYTLNYALTRVMLYIYKIDNDDDDANNLNAPLVDGYELS